MSDFKVAISHLESLCEKSKSLLQDKSKRSNIIVGKYIGAKISIGILEKYQDKKKLDRKESRSVKRLEADYVNKAEHNAAKLEIDEFTYDFVLSTITKTTGLLTGDIDLEKFLQD